MTTDDRPTDSDGGAGSADRDPLAVLPVRDIDPVRAAALGQRARQAFVEAHRHAQGSPWDGVAGLYHRALEPALVATLCCAYLAWAVTKVLTLHL